jgi:hypothetical protein
MALSPPPDSVDRWVGVGSSSDADPARAGAQAATDALSGRTAELALVFCTAGLDAERTLAGICSVTDDETRIVGASTTGEIAPAGRSENAATIQPGVTVLALGGPGFRTSTVVARDASADRRRSGTEAAAALMPIDLPHRALLLIADGLTREQHELVRGAYAVAGATVPIVGGCSADLNEYRLTHQFHGTGAGVEILRNALIGIGLGSTAPLGVGIAHGWRKTGDAMLVTSSEGGTIFELDGQPAAPVYVNRVVGDSLGYDGVRRLAEHEPQAFRDLVFTRPLGLSRRSGEDLRVVHDIDFENGTLACLADVPQGALAWTMVTDAESLIEAAADSCRSAAQALGDADPLGFVVFDCGARKATLGPEKTRLEQRTIAEFAGDRPFGGFYTYGEIGRMQGARGMHHLTVITLALA